MSKYNFAKIRNISTDGAEDWLFSDILQLMDDVSELEEYSIASQLEMIGDGIDCGLHIWSIGSDYILSRTACGYLLASCPEYYGSVIEGREYFDCSQVRRASAILAQIETDAESRVA
jgi:hypothetical protein